jgi:hypothetical protein
MCLKFLKHKPYQYLPGPFPYFPFAGVSATDAFFTVLSFFVSSLIPTSLIVIT